MKRPDDKLFQLIQALQGPEKRYFKLFMSKQGRSPSNHVQLFNAIDRLVQQKKRTYQEEEVMRHVSNKVRKHRSFYKNYLYKQLLRCLSLYHSDRNISLQLKEQLKQVEVLYQKGLWEQAMQWLLAAKKVAIHHERHSLMPEILRWEVNIMDVQAYTSEGSFDNLQKVYQAAQDTLNQLQNHYDYWQLSTRLFWLYKEQGVLRTKKHQKTLNKLMQLPLAQNGHRALTFKARDFYYGMHATHAFMNNNMEQGYRYTRKRVAHYQPHARFRLNYPKSYVTALNNHIIICGRSGRYPEAHHHLKLMEQLQKELPISHFLKYKTLVNLANIKIGLYFQSGDYAKAKAFITQLLPQLKKIEPMANPHDLLSLYYNISCTYLYQKDYKAALHWLYRILNLKDTRYRQDLHVYSRMLHLIIHFELKNFELLQYLLVSTYRFLKKHKRLFRFEDLLLHFIKDKVRHIETEEDIYQSLKNLEMEMEKLFKKHPLEKQVLTYFDFRSWLREQIKTYRQASHDRA